MKLLITGSRNFKDAAAFKLAIEEVQKRHNKNITILLHGGAKGADTLAQNWAEENKIPTQIIKPDYQKHPAKSAPLIRNKELIKLADCTLALYIKERTGGTWFTSQETIKANKPLYEYLGKEQLIYTPPLALLF